MPVLTPPDSPSPTMSDHELNMLRDELWRLSDRERRYYWAVKRTSDVIFSAAVLLFLSPVYLLIALLILIDDPHGSPIYAQTRVGRREHTFKLYKFRSMVVNADRLRDQLEDRNESDGPVFKIKDDPRITRIGKFLRKTSLDELPQFWNVLKGDMTLVGPRPPLPREVEQYSGYHRLRLMVTPGLTCYWQTRNDRNSISFDEWVALDIQYIRDRRFLLDLKLILLTIKVMSTGQGE